jgi:hypothetical protein
VRARVRARVTCDASTTSSALFYLPYLSLSLPDISPISPLYLRCVHDEQRALAGLNRAAHLVRVRGSVRVA